MSHKLAKSRFLQEQVNLDDIPTEEEVLQRAQQLEIDDLALARQSLTKQMEPFWRPYSNRYGDIYYINFKQRKAYVDHPIDIQTKIKYAKSQGLFVPRFKSYDFQDVIGSMQLVEHQIKLWERSRLTGNLSTQPLDSELNIVYEQSGQQSGHRSNQSSKSSYIENLQLKQNEENQFENSIKLDIDLPYEYQRELVQYQNQLKVRHLKELTQYKKQKQQNYQLKLKRNKQQNLFKKQETLRTISKQYETQISEKHQHQFLKEKSKLQLQNSKKIQQYQNLLQKHIDLIQNIHQKRTDVQPLIKRKYLYKKLNLKDKEINQIKNKYTNQLSRTVEQGQKSFRQALAQRIGGASFYQKLVDQQLKKIDKSIQDCKKPRRRKIFQQKEYLYNKENINSENLQKHKAKNIFLQQKQKQIKQTSLWTTNPQLITMKTQKKEISIPIYQEKQRSKMLSSTTSGFKKQKNIIQGSQFSLTTTKITIPNNYNPRNGMYLRLIKRIT